MTRRKRGCPRPCGVNHMGRIRLWEGHLCACTIHLPQAWYFENTSGGMAVSAAAEHLRVTRVTLSRVLNGKSGISANMALRLAAALVTSPDLWMTMQAQHDLWRAKRHRQPTVRRFPHVAEQQRSL